MRKNMVTTCRHANKENEKAKFRGKMEVYLNQFKKDLSLLPIRLLLLLLDMTKSLWEKYEIYSIFYIMLKVLNTLLI